MSFRKSQQYLISSDNQVRPIIVKGEPSKPHAIVVLLMMGDSYTLGMEFSLVVDDLYLRTPVASAELMEDSSWPQPDI